MVPRFLRQRNNACSLGATLAESQAKAADAVEIVVFVVVRDDSQAVVQLEVPTARSDIGDVGHIVVLPSVGAQVHKAVFHRLSCCRVGTADGKRGCRAAGSGLNVPVIGCPSLLPRQQCYY